MADEVENKICFFIAPIGPDGSDIRKRSDQVLRHIIKPAADGAGYKAIRSDEIAETGAITAQVIEHLIDDPLVIADLTGWNPNVFYELAVRHAFKKPVILIIQQDQSIPFDVSTERTIFFDHRDLDSAKSCRDEIIRQIQSIEANPGKIDSPVSRTLDLQAFRRSDDPVELRNAEILSTLATSHYLGSTGFVGTPTEPSVTDIQIFAMQSCPSCQMLFSGDYKICPHCGHELQNK